MSSIKETYQIGQIMKLIDLNKDITNFDMDFKVTADNKAEFDMAIVDQNTLDEGIVDYNSVNGAISGNIRNDKNEYHSYMMALKASKPCTITVETNFQSLPDHIPQHNPIPEPPVKPVENDKLQWKYIVIGIIVIAGLCLLYYFYTRGDPKSSVESTNSLYDSHDMIKIPTTQYQITQPPVAPFAMEPQLHDTGVNDVFAKLRNLPLR